MKPALDAHGYAGRPSRPRLCPRSESRASMVPASGAAVGFVAFIYMGLVCLSCVATVLP